MITHYISIDQLKFLDPWLKARGIPFEARSYTTGMDKPAASIEFEDKDIDTVRNGYAEILPQVRAAQPKNPVFIVFFAVKEANEDGHCAVGAPTDEEAIRIAAEQLPKMTIPMTEPGAEYEVYEAVPLADYEDDFGFPLPSNDFPKPGGVVLLEIGS